MTGEFHFLNSFPHMPWDRIAAIGSLPADLGLVILADFPKPPFLLEYRCQWLPAAAADCESLGTAPAQLPVEHGAPVASPEPAEADLSPARRHLADLTGNLEKKPHFAQDIAVRAEHFDLHDKPPLLVSAEFQTQDSHGKP